jgi:pilus assembly protein CpaB
MAKSMTAGMLRRSDRTIMIAAVVLALIAAALVFIAISSSSGSSSKAPEAVAGTINVVTAAQDIPARTTLTANMLQITPLSASSVLTGTFSAPDSLIGLTTRYPVILGEQLTGSKVGDAVADHDKSLSLVVAPGYRAISVPVQEANIVGGMLLPGDTVDIIAIFSAQDTGEPTAQMMVQNVEVLAVAQKAEEALPVPLGSPSVASTTGSLGQAPDDAKAQPNAGTVTVSVTPDQALLLALTAQDSTLWMALRARGDTATVTLPGVNLQPYKVAPAQ